MEFLISFYDNALIYYPNVFFAVLFFISILVIILVCIGIIVLWKKIRRVVEEIKNDLKQIGRKEKKRISFARMASVFFERKKIFFVYIVRALIVFLANMTRIAFIRINTALEYIETRTERIIEKIGKEVLIDE